MDSKLVRIDVECENILRKYSEGSISDCIRAMEARMGINVTIPSTGISKEDLRKELDRLKEGMQGTMSNFMEFISSGQGAVRIKGESRSTDYPPNVKANFSSANAQASFKNEFRTAAQVKKEGN